MPMPVPIRPERITVRQYCVTSRILGITESKALMMPLRCGSCITVSTSARPKAPTSAGTSEMPPDRSWMPNVKRS